MSSLTVPVADRRRGGNQGSLRIRVATRLLYLLPGNGLFLLHGELDGLLPAVL
jgi:hypothetical protein